MKTKPGIEKIQPYQGGKPIEEVQRELGIDRVVKLASTEAPFPPVPAALEALARGASDLNRYPDGGMYRLRRALSDRHRVSFSQVVPAAGAAAGMM